MNGNAEPRIEGDVLWGLGSADMKGGLAVMLALAETVPEPAVDVTYVFYAGEEVAAEHNGLAHLSRDRPDLLAGDVAILGEPTGGELEAGCQGTLRMEVTPAGRPGPHRPTVDGPQRHPPPRARCCAAVEASRSAGRCIQGCEYREALQAVLVAGGVAGNVVPDAATVTLNHRFAPDRTDAEAADEVAALARSASSRTATRSPSSTARRRRPPGLDNPMLAPLVDHHDLDGHRQARLDRRRPLRRRRRPGRATSAPATRPSPTRADERVERASLEVVYGALADLLRRGA